MKATFVLSFFALAAQVVFANPPACLLQAVNTQDNPADMSAVCGDSATKVQSAIASMCGSDTRATAQSAFIATCSAAGKKVAAYTASSSSSSSSGSSSTRSGTYLYTTAVYNSSCSCTQTIVTSVAAAQATGASSSRTGTSGAAVSTAGAIHGSQQKMGGYAAAAIALVGAVAAL